MSTKLRIATLAARGQLRFWGSTASQSCPGVYNEMLTAGSKYNCSRCSKHEIAIIYRDGSHIRREVLCGKSHTLSYQPRTWSANRSKRLRRGTSQTTCSLVELASRERFVCAPDLIARCTIPHAIFSISLAHPDHNCHLTSSHAAFE